MVDVQKLLEEIGSFGPWHVWVYFWIFYQVCLTGAATLCIVFMQDIPEFICSNPLTTLTNWTFSEIQSIRYSTPKHNIGDLFNGCKHYIRNYSSLASLGYANARNLLENTTAEIDTCGSGPYDWNIKDGMRLSVVNQWSLVCDKAFQVSNTNMVYMIGFLCGSLLASFVTDRYGRKKVTVVAGTLAGIMGVAYPFIQNLYGFFVGRFMFAFFIHIMSPTLYVLALEMCVDSVRKPIAAFYFVAYSIGGTVMAGIGHIVRNWQLLHVAIAAPLLISPLYCWVIPESPRWLISQGREKEARKILEQAAKWNRKEISAEGTQLVQPLHVENQNAVTEPKVAESTNFFQVFRYWKLAFRTVNIYVIWTANAFVYFGVSYLITSFSGNIFINNAIANALETPAYLICFPFLLWARKKSLIVLLLIAGVAFLLHPAVPESAPWAQLLVAFIGKLVITSAFNIVFVITLELYPTSIRGAAMSYGLMISRLGALIAPWIVLIAQKNNALIWVTMCIFGASSLAAGALTFFLPETQNQPLPETLDDAIHYPPRRRD